MAECSLDHPSEQLDLPVQDSNPTELEHYDLVIDGTGFTAAIVACAASRSGKTVLHIDSNNYYGGSSGSFPLEDFQAWCRGAISSKLLSETFTSNEETSVTAGKHLPLYSGSPLLRVISYDEIGDHRIDSSLSRKFTLDLSSKLIYSAGNVVTILINSGVSDYLEFKAVEKLFYRGESDGSIHPVPCSKNEVFKDKLLGPLEKRYLTKFLQFTLDWGREHIAGHEVSTLNERALATGGSLQRPQNKNHRTKAECPLASVPQTSFSIRGFEEHLFTAFMSMNSLGPKLQRIITHALCLHSAAVGVESDTLLTFPGMQLLYRHISALGIFGPTALLQPLYGVGELPQAFCRMCAVWGGIYMLRQTVQSVTISRIPVESKAHPKDRPNDDFDEEIRPATALECAEESFLSDGAVPSIKSKSKSSPLAGEEVSPSGDIKGDDGQNTELSSHEKKVNKVEDGNALLLEGLDEKKDCEESSSSSVVRPLQHVISVEFQDSAEANPRPDSRSDPGSEEGRKTVHCSALLLSAEKVIFPSTLLRAALVTRVLVCKDNKTDSSGIEAVSDEVLAKSRTVTVFPSDSLGFQNKNAIYAVHLDASSCVCPDNHFLVYLTTEIAIPVTDTEHLSGALMTDVALFWDQFVDANKHGANEELDRTASYIIKLFGDIAPLPCSPPSSSSSLPHPESDPHATQDADTLPLPPLALDVLPSDPTPSIPQPLPLPPDPNSTAPSSSSSSPSSSSSSLSHSDQAAAAVEGVSRVTMLLSATTIRPLYHSAALSDKTEEIRSSSQANIALCGETTSSLTMVEEVAQAESIFHTLFPDSTFLPPKTTEKEEEEERERGDIREEI